MGEYNTDPPYSNGVDSDNTLLYKIARKLFSGISATISAGSAIIGKVGIDQTTPGTTNAVSPKQSSAAPTNTAATPFTVLTTAGDILTLAVGEKAFIQNHADAVLCVKLGTGASGSSFSLRLKACTASDDASGGYITIENWIGTVSVAAASGSPRFSAWKI